MTAHIQIITTVPTKKSAQTIGDKLLDARLAGCVQIFGPIQSAYWWNNKIEKANEWRLEIKTKKSFYTSTEKIILQNHPYQIPEIIVIPIESANKKYFTWLENVLKK